MKFTGTIRSMQEGEVVFNNEPLLRVDAPLGEAQIIETALLNIVNYQTLIATKAARMKHAANNDELLEFGTRRAHEFDAALWGRVLPLLVVSPLQAMFVLGNALGSL